MTGMHMDHTSVRSNPGGVPILPEDVTVAELLKGQGYATGCFGKWGLGDISADSGFLFLGMMPVAAMVVCSLGALVGVSLVTAAPPETTIRKYFPQRREAGYCLDAAPAAAE